MPDFGTAPSDLPQAGVPHRGAPGITLIRQFPVGRGGAESYLELLVRGLAARGFKINLLCADCPPHSLFSRMPEVDVVRLDTMQMSRLRWLRPWWFPFLVARWLKHYPQPFVFSLERCWRQDLLRAGDGVHAEWLERRRPLRRWPARVLDRMALFHLLTAMSERLAFHPDRTTCVMANSDFIRRQIVARFEIPERRIHVLHNGIDLGRWSCAPSDWVKRRLGVGDDCLVAAFVGSGWERKGLRVAVDAIGLLAQKRPGGAVLAVAGHGKRVLFRAPCVEFLGELRGADIAHLYQSADLLLLPTHYDPFANVTLEALASGLPVVTSDTNGGAEVLTDPQVGVVVRGGSSAEEWADKIARFDDPTKRERRRQACREVAAQHAIGAHVEQVVALCETILAAKRGEASSPPSAVCHRDT